MTCGTPIATYYLGDSLVSPWYVNFEIGQGSWNKAQVGYGTDSNGTGYNWGVANWYEDGSYPNKRVRRDIGGLRFTSTGNWYIICQANESMENIYTSASACGWVNSITYPPTSLAYFTVNALNTPTGQTATQNSSAQINLAWTQGVSGTAKDTLILRSTSAITTDPTPGAAYSVGNTIGGATVIYKGDGTSTSDTSLSAGTKYYYKFYAENYSYYSAGVTAEACTAPTIGASPQSTTVCTGSSGQFSVTANGSGLSYQWQVNSGSIWADVTDGTGGTTASYTTIATTYAMNGYKYRCAVTDSCGTTSVNSGEATLTVNRPPMAQNISMGACAGVPQTLTIIGGKHPPTDPDSDTLTVSAVTQPAKGTLNYTSSGVTYTYTGNAGSYPDSDSFTYTISDGRSCTDTKTVSVTVSAPGSVNIVYGPVISGNNFVVRFAGIPGYTYTVETNSTSSVTGWGKLLNRTAPTDNSLGFGVGVFEVQDPVAGRSSCFYRTTYPSY